MCSYREICVQRKNMSLPYMYTDLYTAVFFQPSVSLESHLNHNCDSTIKNECAAKGLKV